MADLLTVAEVDERIAALQKLRAQMLPTSRACIKCDTLYAPEGETRAFGRNMCYCDWESDRYDD